MLGQESSIQIWILMVGARGDESLMLDSLRKRSPFLFTAILAVSSLHNQQHIRLPLSGGSASSSSSIGDRVYMQPLAHQQISILAINHATSAFVDGHSSLEVVQAFYILSTWKSPDDSISYLRTGYAAKLAMDLDLSRKQPARRDPDVEAQKRADRQWRSRQRMWMALFVQVSNHALHIRLQRSAPSGRMIILLAYIITWRPLSRNPLETE